MPRVELLLGGPGTGKTAALLDLIEEAISTGVEPDRIAFASFTRAATKEGTDRAVRRFELDESDLPHFRTLHSLAFRTGRFRRAGVLEKEKLRAFSEWVGEEVTGSRAETMEDEGGSTTRGDRMLALVNFARATGVELSAAWAATEIARDVPWFDVLHFRDSLEAYKREHGLVDYADMLSAYLSEGAPVDVDLAILDEAQDLSTVQWEVARKAFGDCPRIVIAGDDDQAINVWSGADVREFLAVPADERLDLEQSHRVPRAVHGVAVGLLGRISQRYAKPWAPRSGSAGRLAWVGEPEDAPLTEPGTWMLLARNNRSLPRLRRVCRTAGVSFICKNRPGVRPEDALAITAWARLRRGEALTYEEALAVAGRGGFAVELAHRQTYTLQDLNLPPAAAAREWWEVLRRIPPEDREYYKAIERRGGSVSDRPTVTVSTVHGVKGQEADNVLLLTDVTARSDPDDARRSAWESDEEHRIFFVGVTRAREALYLVEPQGQFGYRI